MSSLRVSVCELTLNFVQVAFLVFGQEIGVCIFPGIDLPHKQWLKPAGVSVSAARRRKAPANTHTHRWVIMNNNCVKEETTILQPVWTRLASAICDIWLDFMIFMCLDMLHRYIMWLLNFEILSCCCNTSVVIQAVHVRPCMHSDYDTSQ